MKETTGTSPSESHSVSADYLLKAIVSSSDDAIISKDINGIITSWNAGAERLFGYNSEEAAGQPISLIIPEDRQQEETVILSRIRRGERVEHFDTVRRRKDGSLVHVSLSISPIQNDKGEVIGASKIARDISQRKDWERETEAHQKQLERLNSVAISLSAEKNLEALVQKITDAGRELSGAAFGAFFYNAVNEEGEAYMLYTLSGAPREAFERFGMPRNTPIFAPTFNGTGIVRIDDVTKDPRYGQMPPHHGMPKGHLPVRSYLAVPVIARSGTVIGGLFFGHPEPGRFTASSQDGMEALAAQAAIAIENARLYKELQRELDEHKLARKALADSEALSSNVLNGSSDSIQILDRFGMITFVNPAGLAAYGTATADQILGKLWVETWPAETQESVTISVKEALAGKSVRFSASSMFQEHDIKWWDVVITPLVDLEKIVTGLTVISRDITEQKKNSENLLTAIREAEKQSRIKDEFLATLSHELRTPLQSVLGWTQILLMRRNHDDELKQGLEVIDRNANAQSRIIEDLLDMSRILSGKIRLDVQKVLLGPVIEAALDSVRPAAEVKNINLKSILDPLAGGVTGDPNRLQQVFWNLLNNAIKFTPRAGKVQILLERVNSHLEVTVNDSGVGIEPEFLPYVFERFRQADASTTRSHGGLGLGLAIVKQLIELHGGSIRVKSAGHNQGASFILSLPLSPVKVETEVERQHPANPQTRLSRIQPVDLNKTRILVVDDEQDACALLVKILTDAGAVARSATSVKEALAAIKSEIPDIIISDIGMPGEDGYSLIRKVRDMPGEAGRRIPAIALSAYTRAEDRIKSISMGFQMHLAKPADINELLTVIKSLTESLG